MDWFKLLKTKIYNRIAFLIFTAFLIFLILLVIVVINAFARDIHIFHDRYIFNFQNIVDILKQVFKKNSEYWAPEPILIVLFTLVLLWLYVILGGLIKFAWHANPINSPRKWELNKNFNFECFNDLEIQGNISRVNKSLKLTSSPSGILLKHKFWRDLEVKFKFNFEKLKIDRSPEVNWIKIEGQYRQIPHKPENNFFGLLIRAQDLNNYFMISVGIKQIIREEQGKNMLATNPYDLKVLITPHIKVDGNWEVFESSKFDLLDIKIKEDNQVICKVKGNILTLNIRNIIKYQWILPNKFRMNWAGEAMGNVDSNKREFVFGDPNTIPFRDSYGMVGFRAYGEEYVTIKKIVITKLD